VDLLTGNGVNLDDLIGRTQQEFHLTSTEGIIRLLKTRISESIPEKPTPVADTLDNVGSAMRLVLGSNGDSLRSAENAWAESPMRSSTSPTRFRRSATT